MGYEITTFDPQRWKAVEDEILTFIAQTLTVAVEPSAEWTMCDELAHCGDIIGDNLNIPKDNRMLLSKEDYSDNKVFHVINNWIERGPVVWDEHCEYEPPDPTVPKSFIIVDFEITGSPGSRQQRVFELYAIYQEQKDSYLYEYRHQKNEAETEFVLGLRPSVPGYEDQWHSWSEVENYQGFDYET